MPHMRYLFTIVLIGVGCSSSRSQQAAQTEAAFETFNQRCHPPDACDQWSALGYRPGGQAVRFEALSRATSESVFVWLDTVTTPEPGHPRFIPVDSLASKLNARELLAHFCTRKGQTSQEAFIAIVRDTDAVLNASWLVCPLRVQKCASSSRALSFEARLSTGMKRGCPGSGVVTVSSHTKTLSEVALDKASKRTACPPGRYPSADH